MKNETQTRAQDDLFQKDAFLKDISRVAGVQLTDHGSLCLFQFFNERTLCHAAYNCGFTGICGTSLGQSISLTNTKNNYVMTRIFTDFLLSAKNNAKKFTQTHFNGCHT